MRSLRKIRGLFRELKYSMKCLKERVENPGALYLLMTPEHDNLGDHAIAQAEKKLFDSWNLKIIEVTGKELERRKRQKLLWLMNGRTILVHGGGYLGTLWFDAELLLREVISCNPESTILVLPNTLYYENNKWGREEFEKSIRIYNSHRNLHIYARERITYKVAKEVYSNVKLIPDMVMSLNLSDNSTERHGCIICLRGDHERTRTDEEEQCILAIADKVFGSNIRFLDMCVDHHIPVKDRDAELQKQYDAFKGAELVITDRLHGMVFSAITGTPCIVLNSKSPKVFGCYQWLQKMDYIRFCDDPNSIETIYQSMPHGGQYYDNSELLPYYLELKKDIMQAAGKR